MPAQLSQPRGGLWQVASPSARRPAAVRHLDSTHTDRAAARATLAAELHAFGRESLDALLSRHTWTADGWQPDTLGAAIRLARKRAGLTLEDAAARAGLVWQRWREWEADQVEPAAGRLFDIAAALGTTADALRPYRPAAPSTESRPAGDNSARPSAQMRPRKPARPRPSAKIRPTRKTRTAKP